MIIERESQNQKPKNLYRTPTPFSRWDPYDTPCHQKFEVLDVFSRFAFVQRLQRLAFEIGGVCFYNVGMGRKGGNSCGVKSSGGSVSDGESRIADSGVGVARRRENVCSYTETVRWAYVNSGLRRKAKEEDAPSSEAWVLYLEFMEDRDRRWEAYKQVISAKVKKEEIEQVSNADEWDGKAEYDILAAMEEAGGAR